jgi:hypothetical protein
MQVSTFSTAQHEVWSYQVFWQSRLLLLFPQSKLIVLSALIAGASAFAPAAQTPTRGVALFSGDGPKLGAGGMADTRDPEPMEHEDPRKSIKEAPSFEEYLKQRAAQGN